MTAAAPGPVRPLWARQQQEHVAAVLEHAPELRRVDSEAQRRVVGAHIHQRVLLDRRTPHALRSDRKLGR